MSYGFKMMGLNGKEEADGTLHREFPSLTPISLVSSPTPLSPSKPVFLPTQNVYPSITSLKWTRKGRKQRTKLSYLLTFFVSQMFLVT